MERRRKRRLAYCETQNRSRICKKIRAKTLVVGPEPKKKWYGTQKYTPNGKWDRVAEDMMLNISESGHPVIRESSALERGALKSKGEGKLFHISVVTTIQLKWFIAQSFPTTSSVSTEQ